MDFGKILTHFHGATDINVSISIVYMEKPGIQKANIQITGLYHGQKKSRFIQTDISKMGKIIKELIIHNISTTNISF